MSPVKSRIVYALCDPRESPPRIVYIGCTNQKLTNRVKAHINEAMSTEAESRKATWLRELIKDNFEPAYMVLEEVRSSQAWEEREQFWIARTPGLLNDTSGGIGAKGLSLEARKLISDKLTGRKQSAETIAKRKAANAGYRHSDEAKAKISATHKGRVVGALPQEVKEKLRASIAALIWITDGNVNRRVRPDSIPPGFRPGRFK